MASKDQPVDELREKIQGCFKRTKMQQEGDTELFDTELTIDELVALLQAECNRARIDALENVLASDAWGYPELLKALIKGAIKGNRQRLQQLMKEEV